MLCCCRLTDAAASSSMSFFASAKLSPRVAMEVESSEMLKRYVSVGLGLGFLPRTNVAEEEQHRRSARFWRSTEFVLRGIWRWFSARTASCRGRQRNFWKSRPQPFKKRDHEAGIAEAAVPYD